MTAKLRHSWNPGNIPYFSYKFRQRENNGRQGAIQGKVFKCSRVWVWACSKLARSHRDGFQVFYPADPESCRERTGRLQGFKPL